MGSVVRRLEFRRPYLGPVWTPPSGLDLPVVGGTGWQSNGGVSKRHPARALPLSMEVPVPVLEGPATQIHLVGVFALHSGEKAEVPGTLGGLFEAVDANGKSVRVNLVNGRHYNDATEVAAIERVAGDGTSLLTISTALVDDVKVRVDRLTVDMPGGFTPRKIIFRDLGSPASFIIFDVFIECQEAKSCPMHGRGSDIGLGEIGSMLRLRDRPRFEASLSQVIEALRAAPDLDTAKGLAVTFLGVVLSALFELGSSHERHGFLLDAVRTVDALAEQEAVVHRTLELVDKLVDEVFEDVGDALVDRAVALVERNFAREILDDEMARLLGVSTSHFRYLFRRRTGRPFHKYLVAVRLEKAHESILQTDATILSVAESVGFSSPAHFSRAFLKRFGYPPSALRNGARRTFR
ncbi:MAG: helix-turn-helix transcriptional regulator [Fimbriimonadaceae bacterium]|nr:helix-turn-helix transcriptional regulator [Fimbriimonadaceae bacterium]